MTIASQLTQIQYPCNGATTQWSFNNKIFAAADLVATLIDTLGTLYAFTPSGFNTFTNVATGLSYTVYNVDVDSGCFIIFTAAPTSGWTLDLRTAIQELQSTSIKNQGSFLPELHEEFFDKITREVQDLRRLTYTFGIHGPDIEAVPWGPIPSATARANMGLVFNSSGQPSVGVLLPTALTQSIFASFQALTFAAGDVRNYGGVSGSDCATAVTAAAAANKEVTFPPGAWPMATTPTVPLGGVLRALPGSSFTGAGALALGLTTTNSYQYNVNEGDTVTGAAFRDVIRINHSYGGAAMQGGRCSLEVQCGLTSTSSVSNTNRNYVAGNFEVNISANDTGTSAGSNLTAAGAAFGIGVNCVLFAGATCFENATAAEFNIDCHTGSSVYYRSIIQLAELATSAVQGQGFDVMLSLSNQGGVGFQTGIGFNNANSTHPVTATGTLIATQGAHTVAGGVDLRSYTFSAQSFAALGFNVQGNGSQIDLGLSGTANTYLANFHTGAVGTTYDSRIVAFGGSGSNGGGSMVLNSTGLGFYDSGAGVAKQTVSGAKGGNAALTSLMAAIGDSGLKLVHDTTT